MTTKKVKKDKFNYFNVPLIRNGPSYSKSVRHIYDMIQEASPQLLVREDVRKAFNDFVGFLANYDNILVSWSNGRTYKYASGVKITDNSQTSLRELNCRLDYNVFDEKDYKEIEDRWVEFDNVKINSPKAKKIMIDSKDIIKSYTPLYDLIKREVVPYMELKNWDISRKIKIAHYHDMIEKNENDIKQYEKYIERCRSHMGEYAEKVLFLQNPPETTRFD